MGSLVLTGVIGLVALYIAYQQYQTAKNKLQTTKNKLRLDLFDKRLAVFEAAMTLASTVVQKRDVTDQQRSEFAIAARGAVFLFDQKLQDYCDKLHKEALNVHVAKEKLVGLSPGGERGKSAEALDQRILWFKEQLNTEIPKQFNPFLRILE
jgi:hypothetical protein